MFREAIAISYITIVAFVLMVALQIKVVFIYYKLMMRRSIGKSDELKLTKSLQMLKFLAYWKA